MNISELYGKALFDLSLEDNCAEDVRSDLHEINTVLAENSDFIAFLDCPGIEKNVRLSAVKEILADAHPYVVNFIMILTEKLLAYKLADCIKFFDNEYERVNKIEKITVITAVPLNNDEIDRLKKSLENKRKHNVILYNKVDTEILGGMIIEYPDSLTDASIATGLNNIKKDLLDIVI